MDVKKWSEAHFQDLGLQLQDHQQLGELILFTLNNFAHRYFETPTEAQFLGKNIFRVEGSHGPNIKYRLEVEMKDQHEFLITAQKNAAQKNISYHPNDLIELRNKLPAQLEEICTIF